MFDAVETKTIFSQWEETVGQNKARPFLRYIPKDGPVQNFTYEAFDKLVKAYASTLLSLGVKRGDYLAMLMHSCPEYLLVFLASAHIGSILVPINSQFKECECKYILDKTKAKFLFTDITYNNIYSILENCTDVDKIFVNRLDIPEQGKIKDFSKALANASVCNLDPKLEASDTAVILFTSGTTKHPKGAVYSNAATLFGGYFHANQIEMEKTDRFLSSMPPYHMDFQEMALMPVICTGAELIMVEHYSAHKFWKQIVDNKASFTDTMSFMNRTMLLQEVQPWEKNHCLKQIYFSMGLSDKEHEDFEKRFNVRLLNSYGMTETVSAVTCTPLSGDTHWPSVGKAAPGYKIKIIDDKGNELPPGETGEICVHGIPGKSLVSGYLYDEEASQKLLDSDGWLHSGDAGYLDADGWLFFLGRMGDMIKRCGENISALEVECLITSHDKVADAAVVGLKDELRDQKVKAFIKVKEGESLEENEIRHYCCSYLASFKVPTEIEFVQEFPRTATGKIIKNKLV